MLLNRTTVENIIYITRNFSNNFFNPGASETTLSQPGDGPFSNKNVTVTQFISQLKIEIETIETSEHLKKEFGAFARKHNLDGDDKRLYHDYATVKVIFEATRDAGLWGITWDITDREPNSKSIWKQWKNNSQGKIFPDGSAVAECDELSALFAFLVRKLGVKKAGLLWPTWNHTVAVWTVINRQGKDVRILVPNSHIFLDYEDGFDNIDNPEFDPYNQKTIYDYGAKDVSGTFTIPAVLANHFIMQIRRYGKASEQVLHYLSYQRRAAMGNSRQRASIIKKVETEKKQLIKENARPEDIKALDNFAKELKGSY